MFYHQVSEVHNCYLHAGSTFPTTLVIAVGTVTGVFLAVFCFMVIVVVLLTKMLKRMTSNNTTESQDKPHLYAEIQLKQQQPSEPTEFELYDNAAYI